MKRNSPPLEYQFLPGGACMNNLKRPTSKSILITFIAFFGSFVFVLLLSNSLVIATVFGALFAAVNILVSKKSSKKREAAISAAWPEVIDHLVTGIQSGLSISESLIGLATRGPTVIRPYFLQFENNMRVNGDFNAALSKLKMCCAQHGSDQIFEAISISKTLGGSELLNILRTVGTFLRQDLALRREIEVKHGWIKNSAHLSAAAPWLLLLLLSTQPSTSQAFSTPTGFLILLAGLVMTAIAYFWMNRLGRLPELPRVFGAA